MSLKAEIDEVLALLKGLKKEIKEIKDKQSMFTETISNIHQVTEDLSRKFDEMVNVVGVKTPVAPKKAPAAKKKETKADNDKESKDDDDDDEDDDADDDGEVATSDAKTRPKSKATKAKTTEKKKKKWANVMTYFRAKYMTDQKYFTNIMDEKESDALFAEHEKDLKSKKGEKKLKAQVGYLYKSINKNKPKMSALRAMMDKENNEHVKENGTTAVKDQTDEEEDEPGSESDQDE